MGTIHPLPLQGARPLRDDADYARALEEMESLFLAESGSPEARRFDQLAQLIEAYEARQQLYGLSTGVPAGL